MTLNTNV